MTTLQRLPDWQRRWADFNAARAAQPFAWGANDCALFAADTVEAVTGTRLCEELRTHQDARGALRTLRQQGGLAALATRALGRPVLPALARPADVVLLRVGKRECLGVCNGQTALAAGRAGIEAGPMSLATAAWRVG